MSEPTTLLDIQDGIAQITLHRPERLNAWTPQMGAEIHRHLAALDRDDAVRAIIVTGTGRAFCAGADLGAGGDTFAGGYEERESRQASRPIQPWEVRKPIIAAMNGHAIGVGLTLALQYDIRVVADDAKLQFAFVQRGIVPELSSSYIVPRLIGLARASDLMLTGRRFSGQEAVQLGLMNEAVPVGNVLPRAREIAAYIRDNVAPLSAAYTKALLWKHLHSGDPLEAAAAETRALDVTGKSADAREGVMAFLEKRKPRWTMRASEMPEI